MSKKDDKLAARVTELEEDLKRAQADVFNIRRRAEEDKLQIGNFAKKEVVSALLPSIDNLDRAIASTPTDLVKSDYVKGLLAVQKQLETTLNSLGITRVATIGKEFDPQTMEAVAVEGEGSKEIVSEELQAGYNLGGQNIRHAIVKVIRN